MSERLDGIVQSMKLDALHAAASLIVLKSVPHLTDIHPETAERLRDHLDPLQRGR